MFLTDTLLNICLDLKIIRVGKNQDEKIEVKAPPTLKITPTSALVTQIIAGKREDRNIMSNFGPK